MRRKLLCVSGAFTLGIWLAENSIIAAAGIALAAFLFCVFLYVHPEEDHIDVRALLLCCVIAMMTGSARMTVEKLHYTGLEDLADEKVHEISAEVIRTEKKPGKDLKLVVKMSNGRMVIVTVKKDIEEPWRLTGSVICFWSKFEIPEKARNPRCFDYNMYLRSRGICLTGRISEFKTGGGSTGIKIKRMILLKLLEFREAFISRISPDDDEEVRSLLRGMIFGDTQEMSDDMKDDFRRNGTAHILAVSGLHIGLLYSIFMAIRKKAELPFMTPVFILLLFSYGTLTLWSVSVTRAVLMILMLELGNRVDRRYDLLTSLGAVSMLILMINPYQLFGASFMMSFIAVMSIGTVAPRIPDKVPAILRTSLAVQIGLLTYTAYTFNMIPLASTIVNIPVVFLMSLIVSAGVIFIPLEMIAGISVIHVPVSFAARLLLLVNSSFSDIQALSCDVTSPALYIVFLLYTCIIFSCSETIKVALMRKDRKVLYMFFCFASSVILLSAVFSYSPFDRDDIVMVDVGQGDCIHFRIGGKNVMIDGGGREGYDVGEKTLKPYLLKNGVRKIDLAFVTHLHTDHYEGIRSLCSAGMVKKLCVYEGYRTVEKDILSECGIRKEDIIYVSSGDVITVGSARFTILSPVKRSLLEYEELIQDEEDENRKSLMIKAEYKGINTIVTGDIGYDGENDVLERIGRDGLDCDILKVGHHGSRTSTSWDFLKALSPEIAVIQVGMNFYGHPSKEVLDRLSASGIRSFRNDRNGAVGIRIKRGDEPGLKVHVMLGK